MTKEGYEVCQSGGRYMSPEHVQTLTQTFTPSRKPRDSDIVITVNPPVTPPLGNVDLLLGSATLHLCDANCLPSSHSSQATVARIGLQTFTIYLITSYQVR